MTNIMLEKVIGQTVAEHLTAQELMKLVHGLHEGERIDFKRQLPVNSKGFKKASEAICAMANNIGGVLIYGVIEEQEAASGVLPVSFGEEYANFQRAVSDRIEPSIKGIQWRNFPDEGDSNRGLLVIEIPPRAMHIYFVMVDGSYQAFERRGRENKRLSPMELNALSSGSSAADRTVDVERQLHGPLEAARERMGEELVIAYVIPNTSQERLWSEPQLGVDWLRGFKNSKAAWNPIRGSSFVARDVRAAYECVEAVDNGWTMQRASETGTLSHALCMDSGVAELGLDRAQDAIYRQQTGLMQLLEILTMARDFYARWQVQGKLSLVLKMHTSKKVHWYLYTGWDKDIHGEPIQGPKDFRHTIDRDDLNDPTQMGKAAKTWFNRICSAFRHDPLAASFAISDRGVIKTSYMGDVYRYSADVWKAKGFEVEVDDG